MKKTFYLIAPILLGVVVLPLPLIRDFHFESAMIVAVVGSYWVTLSNYDNSSYTAILNALKIYGLGLLFGLPLFLYSLFTNCLSFDGVGFWILIPLPSILLAQAISRLVSKMGFKYRKLLSVLMISLIAIGFWLIEFFTLPQVYFFNHIWGLWPGPIYDETVQITGSFLFFRGITLLWVILLWTLPNWRASKQNTLITVFALFALLFSYQNLDEAGIITPRESLKERLSTHKETEHFDLFFDADLYNQDEVEYWALKHEFFLSQILEQLNIEWPTGRKIESYLYASPWQKKTMVGAKFTSYVPIWLNQDQLHIAKQQLAGVLNHELVHVVSKQFGNDLFNGSWSIGMIEGLAEAIAKDASPESTLDQIIAASKPYPTPKQMQNAFSTTGFYGSAASISYTTAGSFIRFLLTNYPPSLLKNAYAHNDIGEYYPQPLDSLVKEWHLHLSSIPVDSLDEGISQSVFSQQSIFQKKCPHSVNPLYQAWDQYLQYKSIQDSINSIKSLNTVYKMDSLNLTIKREWARSQLEQGHYDIVPPTIDSRDSVLQLELIKADAYTLSGDWDQANAQLNSLRPWIQENKSTTFKYSYQLRKDSLNWSAFTLNRYKNKQISAEHFESLNIPNKLLILDEAIRSENDSLTSVYADKLIIEPLDTDWFGIYENLIDYLIFKQKMNQAQLWIDRVNTLELRPRFVERLELLEKWLIFRRHYSP